MTSSRRAKIWKRTWVGLSITGGLLVILWIAGELDSPLPILAIALSILGVCIFEVQRMGSLAGRRLGAPLALAAALVGLVSYAWLRAGAPVAPVPGLGLEAATWARSYLLEAGWTAAVAIVLGHAVVRSRAWPTRVAAVAFAALYFGAAASASQVLHFAALVLFLFVVVRERGGDLAPLVALGTLLVVSLPGLAIAWRAFDHVGLVALLVVAKIGDVAGYYAGSAFGRHHPFPRISPGKTSEGCLGSFAAGVAAGALCSASGLLPAEPWGWAGGALAGAIVNVAAQSSDLLESWVKRKAGVKDASTWFGPSGGMLDLVDSLFIAVPAALALWPLVLDFAPISEDR
jgi:phosphatidate cytidylyltransferase